MSVDIPKHILGPGHKGGKGSFVNSFTKKNAQLFREKIQPSVTSTYNSYFAKNQFYKNG